MSGRTPLTEDEIKQQHVVLQRMWGAFHEILDIENVSTSEWARRMGTSRQFAHQLFNVKEGRSPNLITIIRAADALGCDVVVTIEPRKRPVRVRRPKRQPNVRSNPRPRLAWNRRQK